MATWVWIVVAVVIVVVVLALVASLVKRRRTRQALQERFGPEYDRTVEESGGERAATSELREREKRHEELDIRPLEPQRGGALPRGVGRRSGEVRRRPAARCRRRPIA